MFKLAATVITVLVMLCVPIGSLAEENKKNEGPLDSLGLPEDARAIGTSKPVICERTMALLKKFTDDKNEQLLIQYKEPQHNTGGMVWWNAEKQLIHVIEFPPMMNNEWACMLVFGTEARMHSDGPRKKGEISS